MSTIEEWIRLVIAPDWAQVGLYMLAVSMA